LPSNLINGFIIAQTATNVTKPITYLSLRTTRLPTFQSAAEVEHLQKNIYHASLRFRARIMGSAGAVAGLFTFFDDTNESDIEILTRDTPATYRFTNQPGVNKKGDEIPQASQKVENLPRWDEWRTHRIDWLPSMSRWFVDGKFVTQSSYSVPRKPSGLIMNMWSNGGEWSGNMSVGDSAELQIQWVQLLFNTSGKREGPGAKRGGTKRSLVNDLVKTREELVYNARDFMFQKRADKGCTTVCKVDGVEKEGFPEVAYVAPNTGNAAERRTATGSWAAVILIGMISFARWL